MFRLWVVALLAIWLENARGSQIERKDDATCGSAGDDAAIKKADKLLTDSVAKNSDRLPPISSRHAVLIVPSDPMEAGERAADAYSALPKIVNDAGLAKARFTKFVVVGTPEAPGPHGISMGDDVCGSKGFVDHDAVGFLRTKVPKRLKTQAPLIFNCTLDETKCPMKMSKSIDAQLPFLQAITLNDLHHNLLPVQFQNQTAELGVAVGNALAMLVGQKGIWEAERVLFVFGGDLSHGLEMRQAEYCDKELVEMMARDNVAEVAKYFRELRSENVNSACNYSLAIPPGRSSIIAALQVAKVLGLKQSHWTVSNNALVVEEKQKAAATKAAEAAAAGIDPAVMAMDDEPAPEMPKEVSGFGCLTFWTDDRFIGERYGAMPPAGHLWPKLVQVAKHDKKTDHQVAQGFLRK